VRWLIILFIVVVSYILGWNSGLNGASADYKNEYLELAKKNGQLAQLTSDQKKQIDKLEAQLKTDEVRLDSVMGPVNTFDIKPNETTVVAGGRLTVGLVGSPSTDKININVNGKQQLAAAGDVINVALSTNCRVAVTSFEMFKAVITTTCADAHP
jgi:alpha-tubulin suppressor-like RCC1 family protein